ncbi:hypothetical protein DP113_32545 [Brasilonema octagenarum UFV-E1]|uniref:Uncharacterized protein n=2 Tax=Brasilonema TaxID=383614 RepID=A0A856MR86_9CYAN|nr:MULTISPECIES: hypothetical protein [Brasilonema]NMF62438.1 hypothetical protein [Brasilonema octagenarum UFV-OR1]QDL11987.1 hypothetical protein DP114_32445 [Brasilonema sennae CENA114]QDL18362.1 hypothetical protein DP113_32545 [Brasilonema octagenarum UFV-E1]
MLEIIINKSVEILFGLLLEKFGEWLLNERNLKLLNHLLKKQILLLYLHWLLLKTPQESLPKQPQQHDI